MAKNNSGVTTASEYTRSYTTFSGCDIVATFGSEVVAEIQGITVSINREKAPVYTFGSAEPRSISRGKTPRLLLLCSNALNN